MDRACSTQNEDNEKIIRVSRKPVANEHFKGYGVGGRIILKIILMKLVMSMWIGFMWLRIELKCGLFLI